MIFIKPVDYSNFLANHASLANKPGVYIWGFMDKNTFIPYYVGKSEDSIFERIQEHFNKIKKQNTYTIFTNTIYKDLSRYLCFLLRTAKPYKNLSITTPFSGNILYLNNSSFLASTYRTKVKTSALHLLAKGLTSQKLDTIIINHNPADIIQPTINKIFSGSNLYVTYAELKNEKDIKVTADKKQWQRNLRIAETCIKFCLKTNTIGDSLSLENIKNTTPFITISSVHNCLRPLFYPLSNGIPTVDIQKHNSVYNYNGYR